ncbi:hypothetical protein ABW19_dt0202217 [Dactylella cylindrospora]|nr:hypothetical protein ABW19_dt0202217 [Dactylella cylindrospora]
MSSESIAALRKSTAQDLAKLAEEHFNHDLYESDRQALKSAAGKLSTYATVGSLVGLGLSVFLSFRLRQNRKIFFEAFRAREKPTSVKFADGREEALPDITQLLKPTTLGDFATYTFFGAGGLFLGGEIGFILGNGAAARTIKQDPESAKRIDAAFRNFRIDILKKQIEILETTKPNVSESLIDKVW